MQRIGWQICVARTPTIERVASGLRNMSNTIKFGTTQSRKLIGSSSNWLLRGPESSGLHRNFGAWLKLVGTRQARDDCLAGADHAHNGCYPRFSALISLEPHSGHFIGLSLIMVGAQHR